MLLHRPSIHALFMGCEDSHKIDEIILLIRIFLCIQIISECVGFRNISTTLNCIHHSVALLTHSCIIKSFKRVASGPRESSKAAQQGLHLPHQVFKF